jgi:hypothetical protein
MLGNTTMKGIEMETDVRLEELSDKARMGIPIDFAEALEVIEYQETLRAEREAKKDKTLFGRLRRWLRSA